MGASAGKAAKFMTLVIGLSLARSAGVVSAIGAMQQTAVATAQPPTRVVPSGPPLYEKAPHSLREMLGLADLVIVGTVERSEQSFVATDAVGGRVIVHPIVHLGIRVEQLVKGTAAIGALVEVAQPGGSVLVQGTQYVQNNSENPVLVVGERAIFILKPWPSVSAFQVVLGPAGLLRVSGTTVTIPRELKHVPDLANAPDRPLPALIELMRGLARGRR